MCDCAECEAVADPNKGQTLSLTNGEIVNIMTVLEDEGLNWPGIDEDTYTKLNEVLKKSYNSTK